MKRILSTIVGILFIFGVFGCSGSQAPSAGIDTTAAPADEVPVEYMDPKGSPNTTQGATQTNE